MQIEFGNTASHGIISSYDAFDYRCIRKSCKTVDNATFDGQVTVKITDPYNEPKSFYAFMCSFNSARPTDPNYYVKELTIKNSTKYPKAIHIQKIINAGGSTIHPFILLPNVTITLLFPTVDKDIKKLENSSTATATSVTAFSGHLLIVSTPVFVAGKQGGSNTIDYKGPDRRLFYNRLFDYKDDLNKLKNYYSGLQNVVFYQNVTLDLSTVSDLVYDSIRNTFCFGSPTSTNKLSFGDTLHSINQCPYEAIPVGTGPNKVLFNMPYKCTKKDLRNVIILEFVLPSNADSVGDCTIDYAYKRDGVSSIYKRNTAIKQKADSLSANYGMVIIPCSYRPDYHYKIARIITKITM